MLSMVLALQLATASVPDGTEGCTDKDGTLALSSCYSQRADAWEQRLAAAYPAALRHVQGPQRRALRRAQAAWRRYRTAGCAFYDLTPGSIHVIQSAYCMLDLTRRRALELEDLVLP
jgi:uncharacterized protein YecT (DUF1311 family)